MSQTAQWHYAEGGATKGPFSAEQMAAMIQSGTIGPQTQVWSQAMGAWAPLAQSPLAGQAPPRPPQAPPSAAGMPPAGMSGVGYPSAQAAMHSAGQHAAAAGAAFSAATGSGIVANMVAAVTTCLNKYVVFSGRAARPELWYYALAMFLMNIVVAIADMVLGFIGIGISLLGLLFALATFLPSIAVGVRRLHDTDRSAWWLLIVFVPLIGSIVLLVFYCLPGTPGRNRFG